MTLSNKAWEEARSQVIINRMDAERRAKQRRAKRKFELENRKAFSETLFAKVLAITIVGICFIWMLPVLPIIAAIIGAIMVIGWAFNVVEGMLDRHDEKLDQELSDLERDLHELEN